MVGPGERTIGIADHFVDLADLVRAPVGMHQRSVGRERLPRIEDVGEGFVVDIDALGAVDRGPRIGCQHHRHRLAHVVNAIACEWSPRWGVVGSRAGNQWHPLRRLGSGEDADNIRNSACVSQVDRCDVSVCEGAAHERGMDHVGHGDVVYVTAPTRQDSGILLAG